MPSKSQNPPYHFASCRGYQFSAVFYTFSQGASNLVFSHQKCSHDRLGSGGLHQLTAVIRGEIWLAVNGGAPACEWRASYQWRALGRSTALQQSGLSSTGLGLWMIKMNFMTYDLLLNNSNTF